MVETYNLCPGLRYNVTRPGDVVKFLPAPFIELFTDLFGTFLKYRQSGRK
jgi:hypothetical protein